MGVALDCRQPKSAAYQLLNMKKSKSLKSEIEFNKWLKKTRAINTRVRTHHFFDKVGCVFLVVIWSEFHMEYRDKHYQNDAPHFKGRVPEIS